MFKSGYFNRLTVMTPVAFIVKIDLDSYVA